MGHRVSGLIVAAFLDSGKAAPGRNVKFVRPLSKNEELSAGNAAFGLCTGYGIVQLYAFQIVIIGI